LLLHHGADHTIKNNDGWTALDLAIKVRRITDPDLNDSVAILQSHENGQKTLPLTEEENLDFISFMKDASMSGLNAIRDKIMANTQHLWKENCNSQLLLF
jgi:hypothetical protein